MFDIIVLLILAFFVFKKLKSILGEEYDDKTFGFQGNIFKKKIKEAEKVLKNEQELESEEFSSLDVKSKNYAVELSNKINGFSLKKFINTAEKVLESVIKAS